VRAEDVGVGPSTFADGTWEWTGVGNVELDGEGIWDVIEDAASSNDDRLDCLFSRAIFAGIGDGGAMAGEGEGGASPKRLQGWLSAVSALIDQVDCSTDDQRQATEKKKWEFAGARR